MKYKYNNQWVDLSIKALDSMPVGTQVEYTGSTIPTGWEQVNDYSTTEIDTGKRWIDGKKIYRKVIDYTGSVGTNNGDNTDIGEITNLEKVINYSAMIKTGNTVEDHIYISYAYNSISTDQWQCYRVFIDDTTKKVRFNVQRGSSTSPRTIDEIIVIVEYTKTS